MINLDKYNLESQNTFNTNSSSNIIKTTNGNNLPSKTSKQYAGQQQTQQTSIVILKQHPMYDCLILTKRFNLKDDKCIIEFPTFPEDSSKSICRQLEHIKQLDLNNFNVNANNEDKCYNTKFKLIYLDGDDPMYQAPCSKDTTSSKTTNAADNLNNNSINNKNSEDGKIVYVPMNGLLSRLEHYESMGINVDSKVYAFAIGLKTANQFMTSGSMIEMQESPSQ